MNSLEALDVRSNYIGNEGVQAIALMELKPEMLLIEDNLFGKQGKKALANIHLLNNAAKEDLKRTLKLPYKVIPSLTSYCFFKLKEVILPEDNKKDLPNEITEKLKN